VTGTRSPRPVLIVGAGGFGRETAALLHTLRSQGEFEPAGFLDDSEDLQGGTVAGLPVLGGVDAARDLGDLGVVVTIGNPRAFDLKRQIVERLDLDPSRYVTLVHPTASIGSDTRIGEGTVILAGTVATQNVTIGRHVTLMPNVVLTHDDVIGDFTTFGAGAKLAGAVTVEDGAYIGAGACIRESTTIGAGAMVGMGAVVLSDIPPGETWAGVPAQRIR
jgi:sugar O-acyltransferase (sialic acid O-acetyltransferase NeuD family)